MGGEHRMGSRDGMREPVPVLDADDPVAAFGEVAAAGGRLALPTSGTSGLARVVVRSTRSWTDSFEAVARLTDLSSTSRVWIPGPLTATMNLFAAVHAAAAGATRVESLATATHAQLTPAGLRRLLDSGADLRGRTVVVAGDALDPSLRLRAEEAGARVAHYYGAAELSFVAWGPDRDELRPFPGVDIEVRDGEIWVRSPYLASGYLRTRTGSHRRPSRKLSGCDMDTPMTPAPSRQFPEGPGGGAAQEPGPPDDRGEAGPLRIGADGFGTVGDRGRLDGDRVVVDGRPDAITTGGATVLIADIEAVLRPVIRGELVVVGVPHPTLGAVVVGMLTDEADLGPVRHAAMDLGAGRPRRWYVRADLPLTAAGKVDRASLAAELAPSTDVGRRVGGSE